MAKILVVANDEAMRRECEEELGKKHQVETAADGKEALIKLKDQIFNVVVTDENMPDMDGLALFKAIHTDLDLDIAVIFINSDAWHYRMEELAELGVVASIKKPTEAWELPDIVDCVLEVL